MGIKFSLTIKKLLGGGDCLKEINAKIDDLAFKLSFIKELLIQSNKDNLNAIFNTIYETNTWGKGSGIGSDAIVCATYVQFLQDFFKKHKIKTVVDCGCGDWQFSCNIDFSGIDYKGFDVASFVIEQNVKLFQKKNVNFFHYNGDFKLLPSADLLICKDVLQHLSNAKIKEFISILPHFKFALITNDIGDIINADISTGAYRALDLRQEPFNLDLKVVHSILRMPNAPDMPVMLWENAKK